MLFRHSNVYNALVLLAMLPLKVMLLPIFTKQQFSVIDIPWEKNHMNLTCNVFDANLD